MWNTKKQDRNCLAMDHKEKVLQLLGLVMRAGKLVTGEDATIRSIQNGQAKIVLIAKNTGENTTKRVTDKCSFYQVPLIQDFTQEEISHALGKSRVVCAVTEAGFAKKINELIHS